MEVMLTAVYVFTIINFVLLCGVIGIVWRSNDMLVNFTQWLRRNNPSGEIDITMGNGDKYRIKMDKI